MASLLVAVAVIGGFVWWQASSDDDDPVDARIDGDTPSVVDRPADGGLANPDVEGDPLPDVEVSDADGNVIATSSFLGGDPLVFNFWFSTCAPCAKELPDFAEVHAEVADAVRFIGINPIDSVPAMERFAGERGVEYELYRDDVVEFQVALGLAAFPVTIFVTPDGTIVEQTGVLDADGLREKVDELLELSS